MNLLDLFLLERTQLVTVRAECKQTPAAHETVHAKVELKLSPKEVSGPGTKPFYQVIAEVQVIGFCGAENGPDRQDIFDLEIKSVASYRQFQGEEVDFRVFSEHHPSLARQLYPLLHVHMMELLQQLGLGYVQLPNDLAHAHVDASSQVH